MAVAAAATALIAVAGCGGGDDDAQAYPASAERNFLQGCKKQGGTAALCRCTLSRVKETFSYEEFKAEDTAIAAGRTPSRKLTDALAECR